MTTNPESRPGPDAHDSVGVGRVERAVQASSGRLPFLPLGCVAGMLGVVLMFGAFGILVLYAIGEALAQGGGHGGSPGNKAGAALAMAPFALFTLALFAGGYGAWRGRPWGRRLLVGLCTFFLTISVLFFVLFSIPDLAGRQTFEGMYDVINIKSSVFIFFGNLAALLLFGIGVLLAAGLAAARPSLPSDGQPG